MKIEGLIANVTPVGSPARAERECLGSILDVFGSIQAAFMVGAPLCGLEIPIIVLCVCVCV